METTQIAPQPQASLQFDKCSLSRTGLQITPECSFEEWEKIGETLRTIEGATNFWIGDWINAGESRYGEKYSQAMDMTDKDIHVLTNIASVCRKVEISRRNEILSYQHHVEVAKLEPKDQDKWIKIAVEKRLTTRELRESIRSGKVITVEQINRDSGKDSGLLVIQGVIARAMLWKRNVVDAGKIKWTRETVDMLDDEVIRPLKDLIADLEIRKTQHDL